MLLVGLVHSRSAHANSVLLLAEHLQKFENLSFHTHRQFCQLLRRAPPTHHNEPRPRCPTKRTWPKIPSQKKKIKKIKILIPCVSSMTKCADKWWRGGVTFSAETKVSWWQHSRVGGGGNKTQTMRDLRHH